MWGPRRMSLYNLSQILERLRPVSPHISIHVLPKSDQRFIQREFQLFHDFPSQKELSLIKLSASQHQFHHHHFTSNLSNKQTLAMNFPQKKTNIRFPISESSAESETARLIAHFHDPSLAGRNGLRLLDVDAEEVVVEASASRRVVRGLLGESWKTRFLYTRHIGNSRTFIIGLYNYILVVEVSDMFVSSCFFMIQKEY